MILNFIFGLKQVPETIYCNEVMSCSLQIFVILEALDEDVEKFVLADKDDDDGGCSNLESNFVFLPPAYSSNRSLSEAVVPEAL